MHHRDAPTIVGTAALTLGPTSRSADSKKTSLIILFLTMILGGSRIAAGLGVVRWGGWWWWWSEARSRRVVVVRVVEVVPGSVPETPAAPEVFSNDA